jgi:phospholipase A1
MALGALFIPFLAAPARAADAPPAGWQACAREADPQARLACYDGWAGRTAPPASALQAAPVPLPAPAPGVADEQAVAAAALRMPGCGDAKSPLARFWDLETETGCRPLGLRLYRPLQLALVAGDSVNRAPTSGNPANVVPSLPYRPEETRIQLSVRTKILEGLLTERGPLRDSLWFGYTQQSYWQLFTPGLSRPFRNTDHEPEVMYVFPLTPKAFHGWTPRFAGLGLVHQSNGQDLPRSRSWNRVYLMAGADREDGTTLQARVWQRLREDPASDDNPGISDYVGRAELTAGWQGQGGQSFSVSWRNTLRTLDRGSLRLEWTVPVNREEQRVGQFGRLRAFAQLFTGYGDSLLDYNRPRTVFSVGLSLAD